MVNVFGRADRAGIAVLVFVAMALPGAIAQPLTGGGEKSSATSSARSTSSSQASKPTEFIVATYNISCANRDLVAVMDNILKSKADVVALQEVNKVSAAYFRQHLIKPYPYMKFHEGRWADGPAILSKTPLQDARILPPKFGFHTTVLARTELTGRSATLASVHLQPTVPPPGASMKDILALFSKNEDIRAKEIAYIHSQLPTSAPVLLLGDFNSLSSTSKASAFLAAKGFIDSMASVLADADQIATWRWLYKGVPITFRLDYIFHTAHFKTLSCTTLASEASDHFLVVSKMKWAATLPASAPSTSGPAVTEKR